MLLGGKRRAGKVTSSEVILLERIFRLPGNRYKMGGQWLPGKAYDFDRGRRIEW